MCVRVESEAKAAHDFHSSGQAQSTTFSDANQHWLPKWQQQQQMRMEKQKIHLVKIKMCPNHEIVLHICGLFEYTEHTFSMGRMSAREREANGKRQRNNEPKSYGKTS